MAEGNTKISNPARLISAGTQARQVAGDTKTAGQLPVDDTRAASRNFSGGHWDGGLGSALNGLAETWSGQCSALVNRVAGLGNNLESTGNGYNNVERTNAHTMRSVPRETSPFG
ncbi:type VII secretion target [Streptomyces sp. NPDC003077]|uniref:type VII secretion target n=1 Tax=Streptomyces sp. NPDC003077 TaxID=3154443 RepID=UPI0033BCCD6B